MKERIAVIGAGMIGGAIIKSLLKGGYPGKIIAADIRQKKILENEKLGIAATTDNKKAATESDIIFICVKPSDVEKVLREISSVVKDKIVISVAATVTIEYLKKFIPDSRIVRIMPNIAALVQASYTAYCYNNNVTRDDIEKVEALLNLIGICEKVEEKYMDAVTALSGSGPGYLSIIIEALMYSGLKVGLPRNVALKSSAQTVLGTGKLVLELGEHPARIKDMVTTPGGTTIEAIYELEGSQIRQSLMRAIGKAAKKSQLIREKIGVNVQ